MRRVGAASVRNGLVCTAAFALACFAPSTHAHPHGTVQCSLAVGYKHGQPQRLSGRLLFDQAHSEQALLVLRNPETQKLDEALKQRFVFGLRQQLARWNWLFAVSVDGQTAELTEASPPALWWSSDGRLGVQVELAIATDRSTLPGAASGGLSGSLLTISCIDPTRYWVSEFVSPDAEPKLVGCVEPVKSPAVKHATGPQAGGVSVQVQCLR